MDTSEIEKRQITRFRLLLLAYEKGIQYPFHLVGLAMGIGIKNGVFDEALSFLLNEKLIDATPNGGKCTITHEGKKMVEYMLTNKEKATDLFPSFSDMGL